MFAAVSGLFGGAPTGPAPKLDDFELVKVVGKGSYGKVLLVKHKEEGGLYAMKMLRKEHVVKRNQVEHTKAERNVLERVNHPFIVNLLYAFQTPKKLHFVLEFAQGGELFFHLSRAGRFSEGRAKFYTSEILLAVGYLHSLNIIYRDLKPENVLLDGDGHAKLTDFGLSKEGIEDNVSAKSMCGTPEYLAPEILDKRGHGKAVDWYSLGALAFEMLTGLPPYYSKNREQLFQNIKHMQLKYPAYISVNAKACLERLLCRDPHTRLGAAGQHEVQSHIFFLDVDFNLLQAKKIVPPFRPEVANNPLKYVDKEFLVLPTANSEVPGEREVMRFEGFSYQGQ